MINYKLKSLDELFLIQCVLKRDFSTLNEYFHKCMDSKFLPERIWSMVDAGIFNKDNIVPDKFGMIDMFDLVLTNEFLNKYYVTTKQAGIEFWDKYPNFADISGQSVPLKKGYQEGNRYIDKDALIDLYLKKINYDLEKHNEITKKLDLHKDSINVAIRSFILDELWESYPLETQKAYNPTESV